VKFPRLLSECSINWFYSWPTEAIVDVAAERMVDFSVDCEAQVRDQLYSSFALVHQEAVNMAAASGQR